MSEPVLIDRVQFTLTVTGRYLFPFLTMGLALFVGWLKTVSLSERFRRELKPQLGTD